MQYLYLADGGSGCIYVYQYNSGLGSDSWVLLDHFQPQTGLSYYFGSSSDISKFPNTFDKSTLLAVGAKGFGKGARESTYMPYRLRLSNNSSLYLLLLDSDWNPGYVYMYSLDQNSNKFVNETVLESPVGHNSLFGASVALYDNVLAVGAEGFRKSYKQLLYIRTAHSSSVLFSPSQLVEQPTERASCTTDSPRHSVTAPSHGYTTHPLSPQAELAATSGMQ